MAAEKSRAKGGKMKTAAKKTVAAKKSATKKKSTASKKTVAKRVTSSAKSKTAPAKKAARKPRKKVLAKNAGKVRAPRTRAVATGKLAAFRRSFLSSALVMAMAMVIIFLFNPPLMQSLQANFFSLVERASVQELLTSRNNTIDLDAFLLTRGPGDANAQKLHQIFSTVFPQLVIQELHYESDQAQDILRVLDVREVPTIVLEDGEFDMNQLSPLLQNLFRPHQGYHLLNASLINLSDQLVVTGTPQVANVPTLGLDTAPLVMYVYADTRDQYSRANEINHLHRFEDMIRQGQLQVTFIDLPQSNESQVHSTALNCLHEVEPDEYLSLRARIMAEINFSESASRRALEDFGVDYNQCDSYQFDQAAAEAKGVVGLPAYLIGRRGESTLLRLSGTQDWSIYQAAFDELTSVQ